MRLVILGSGPAGTAAAFAARERGLDVTLIERHLTGGTCLNAGCIPTKLLLGGSEAASALEVAKGLRLASGDCTLDLAALMARKDRFVKGTRQAVEKQCASLGIQLIRGEAVRISAGTVTVREGAGSVTVSEGAGSVTVGEGALPNSEPDIPADNVTDIPADAVIIATGSRAAAFAGMQPDGAAVLDATGMLELKQTPQSLLIVGAGAIGLEMGEFFHRLGTQITLIEAKDRLAPTEDPEVGQILAKHFSKAGWTIRTGCRVAALTTHEGRARLRLESGEELDADKALVAIGRQPNTDTLELPAGVARHKAGWLQTDACLRVQGTSPDTMPISMPIYAVGDVNGRTLLAHAAEHQARYAVNHLCSASSPEAQDAAYLPPAMPACIYGHMEVMRAGPTAEELSAQGHSVMVSRSQLIANPIAQAAGTTAGSVKICWVDGRVRGITAVGHGVTHLVSAAAIMVTQGWTTEHAESIIFAHPTLDEALAQALKAAHVTS